MCSQSPAKNIRKSYFVGLGSIVWRNYETLLVNLLLLLAAAALLQ